MNAATMRRWSWRSRLLRTHSLLGSLLLAASPIIPAPTFAAPATDIRVVRVPVVTGAPLLFVRLPWKSTRFEVKRITQDNKGFLWFGASDGLRRYDGVRFIRVPGESPSQRSSRIHPFRVDDERPRRHDLVRSRRLRQPIRSRDRQHHAISHQRGPCVWLAWSCHAHHPGPRRPDVVRHRYGTSPPRPGDLAGHVLSRFCRRRFAKRSD